jgi:hypothetical protein
VSRRRRLYISNISIIRLTKCKGIFFSNWFASHLTMAWSTFTGLAFAIGGTATEFFAACFFVFVKNPYDVGDDVVIDKKFLRVEGIYLMHSTFRNQDENIVQIPHSELQKMWITNFSRSNSSHRRELLSTPKQWATEARRFKMEAQNEEKEAKRKELLALYGLIRGSEGESTSTESSGDDFMKMIRKDLRGRIRGIKLSDNNDDLEQMGSAQSDDQGSDGD